MTGTDDLVDDPARYLYFKGERHSRVYLAVLTYCLSLEEKIHPSDALASELEEQGFVDKPDVLKVGKYLEKRFCRPTWYASLAKKFMDFDLPL